MQVVQLEEGVALAEIAQVELAQILDFIQDMDMVRVGMAFALD